MENTWNRSLLSSRIIFVGLLLLLAGAICVFFYGQNQALIGAQVISVEGTPDSIPPGIRRLLAAYPDYLIKGRSNAVLWKDSTWMPYDDGIVGKTYDQLLHTPDLEDQMQKEYPKGTTFTDPTAEGADTNRISYTPFFEKMYGKTQQEVLNNLATVHWLPSSRNLRLKITRVNNIHKHLQAISDELDKRPHLIKYLNAPGGTFNWRSIRGTDRRSAHGFGIAVDINVKYADYWLWDRQLGRPHRYKNRYPLEIIEIFEKHGFIWGGKWYYYDTMHFEYRPELLID